MPTSRSRTAKAVASSCAIYNRIMMTRRRACVANSCRFSAAARLDFQRLCQVSAEIRSQRSAGTAGSTRAALTEGNQKHNSSELKKRRPLLITLARTGTANPGTWEYRILHSGAAPFSNFSTSRAGKTFAFGSVGPEHMGSQGRLIPHASAFPKRRRDPLHGTDRRD